MKPNIIIGAGLTGLVAAEQLNRAGCSATVFEAEAQCGGACRSIEKDLFTFDYTGHLLHINHEETEKYLQNLNLWDKLEVHERRAGIDVGGLITPYPIQINTHGLSNEVRRDCVLGFVQAWAARDEQTPANFYQWVLSRFGEGFARHFFFPYNSKLYRAKPEELSLDWVGRYVPKPALEDVIDGAFGLYTSPIGYNATFRYPKHGGIRMLADGIANHVDDLRLGQRIVALNLEERWLKNASGERYEYENAVFTGSLPLLSKMVLGSKGAALRETTSQLRWVQVVNLALGVEGDAPRPEHWLYFPDEDIPFYRVGFPSNQGSLAPPGHHTISIEVSLDPGCHNFEEILSRSENILAAKGLLDSKRIRVRQIIKIDPAYVVFDHQRRQAVASLRREFRRHGVLLAGRWAEWKYSAMEDAILDGKRIARTLRSHQPD